MRIIKQYNIFGGLDEMQADETTARLDRNKDGSHKDNPMHRTHGKMEGKRCKSCEHFYALRYANTYFKCAKRGPAKASASNDHRANWTACGLFSESNL